jgi:hypothetical protein
VQNFLFTDDYSLINVVGNACLDIFLSASGSDSLISMARRSLMSMDGMA